MPAPRRDPTTAPPPIEDRRKVDLRNAKASRATRLRNEALAQERIDAGKPAGKAPSVHVRSAQMDLERRQAEEARLGCPVEQAKTALRKRFAPVVGAEILDPPGPKGMFLVGRKLVDEAELLAMAERLVA